MATEPPVCADDTAVRALEMHRVEGEIIRILAPLDRNARTRTMAAVLCLQSTELSLRVVREFMAGTVKLDESEGTLELDEIGGRGDNAKV